MNSKKEYYRWHRIALKDAIADISAGTSVRSEDRLIRIGEIGVLRTSAVTYGYFNPEQHKAILPEEQQRASTPVRGDRIIISRMNTLAFVGASAYVDKDYPNLYLPDRLWQIEANSNVNTKWLSYVLASDKIRAQIADAASGTSASMKNISQASLLALQIDLPPLPEQKKIAGILSTWDRALHLNDRLIEACERRKRGLMQGLLSGGMRLRRIGSGTDPDSRVNAKSWKRVSLETICEINPKFRKNINDNELVSFVGMSDVSEQAQLIEKQSRLYAHVKKGFTSFQDGDILVAKITPCFENGKGLLANGLINGVGFGSTEFHIIRPNEDIDSRFIYYHTITRRFRGKGVSQMTGSAGQQRVPKEFIKTYQIGLPTLIEQRTIASILSTCDNELALLRRKRDGLERQKRGLMQMLLTGTVRVRPDEEVKETAEATA